MDRYHDEAPRQAAAYRRVTRRETLRSRSASGTYGRLQAAAVDRAIEDDTVDSLRRRRRSLRA